MSKPAELYHISFRGDLTGEWIPRPPDGLDVKGSDKTSPTTHSEPDTPRISLSPTIQQCFQAIYPNISHLFEVENYPYADMYVYSPVLTRKTKLVDPKTLTKERLVWDAFHTEEHWITNNVRMERVFKIRVINTERTGCILIRPFNDPKLPKDHNICPKEVRYSILKSYHSNLTLKSKPLSMGW